MDGAVPAAAIPKWPLKPGVLVHVNNNHSLNARRLQNASNNNVNVDGNQTQNQFYEAIEKRPKRGEETLNRIGIESQRSRVQRIKRMFFTEQLKYINDTAPGVFYGKSGGKVSLFLFFFFFSFLSIFLSFFLTGFLRALSLYLPLINKYFI